MLGEYHMITKLICMQTDDQNEIYVNFQYCNAKIWQVEIYMYFRQSLRKALTILYNYFRKGIGKRINWIRWPGCHHNTNGSIINWSTEMYNLKNIFTLPKCLLLSLSCLDYCNYRGVKCRLSMQATSWTAANFWRKQESCPLGCRRPRSCPPWCSARSAFTYRYRTLLKGSTDLNEYYGQRPSHPYWSPFSYYTIK